MSFCTLFSSFRAAVQQPLPNKIICTEHVDELSLRKYLKKSGIPDLDTLTLPALTRKYRITFSPVSTQAKKITKFLENWDNEGLTSFEKNQELKLFKEFFRMPHHSVTSFNYMLFSRDINAEKPSHCIEIIGDDAENASQIFSITPDKVELTAELEQAVMKEADQEVSLLENEGYSPRSSTVIFASPFPGAGATATSLAPQKTTQDFLENYSGALQFGFMPPPFAWRFQHTPTIPVVRMLGQYGGFPIIHELRSDS